MLAKEDILLQRLRGNLTFYDISPNLTSLWRWTHHTCALNAADKGGKNRHKIVLMSSFARGVRFTDVPDPYYGGPQEFELVLDLLEDACAGLIEKLRNENPSSGA